MNETILNISLVIIFINFLLYARGFFLFGSAYKFFTIYLGIISFLMIFVKYTFANHLENIFLVHIYILARFVCLSLFFRELIVDFRLKKGIKIVLGIYIAIILFKIYRGQILLFQFSLFESFTSNFFIGLYSIYYFYQQIGKKKEFYYINWSISIYTFGGSLFYLTSNLLAVAHQDLLPISLNINFLFVIVANIIFLWEWKKNYSIPSK